MAIVEQIEFQFTGMSPYKAPSRVGSRRPATV
jgi:hypothetical protein